MSEVCRERVFLMHPSSVDGVEDMSCLTELHEAAIMHNLHLRYQGNLIYVRTRTRTHAHTHTDTHTHTHTHTHVTMPLLRNTHTLVTMPLLRNTHTHTHTHTRNNATAK